MKKFLVLYSFSLLITFITAQEIKQVNNIKGTSYISGDISPNQARIQALNDAKVNALIAAGIEEHINSYQLLFTSQQNNDYTQLFNSDIQTEIQGAVQSYTIISNKVYCKNDNEVVYEILINANVIKYNTKPDITFDANIEGIKAAYNNNEPITFTINVSQDCYLTIFNITDKEAFLLYPNAYEKQTLLSANKKYRFPTTQINYIANTEKTFDTNRLIFVFTKKQIPFIKMNKDQFTTPENIFSWIFSIMPDQRNVKYLTYTIQK
jgi:hypothetical protein